MKLDDKYFRGGLQFKWAGIVIILGLAIILRGYAIESRGLIADDEGFYAGAVKTYAALYAYVMNAVTGIPQEGLVSYFSQYGGNPILGIRPTFVVLGFFASLFIGVHDYTLIYVSALFGVLSVLCVYLVTKIIFQNIPLALLAAFLLAISPLHVAYSRTAYSDMTASALVWLAILFYIVAVKGEQQRKGLLWSSALLLGTAFVTHPSLFWAPAVLLLIEFIRVWGRNGTSISLKHLLMFSSLVALPAIFWEGFLRTLRYGISARPTWAAAIARESGAGTFFTLSDGFRSALGTAVNPMAMLPQAPAPEYSYYIRLLFMHEGSLPFLLFAVGLLVLVLARRELCVTWAKYLLLGFIVVPLLLCTVLYYYPKHPAPRFLLVLMPAFTICVALSLDAIVKIFGRKYRYLGWAACIAIMTSVTVGQIGHLADILSIRSGFPEVVRYMGAHEGWKHLSDHMYISRIYVGRQNAIDNYVSIRATDADRGYRHISVEKLKELYSNGYRYFVRVPGLLYTNETVMITGGTYLLPETQREPSVKPVYEVYHPQGDYWPPEIRRSDRDAAVPQKLSVYLLRDIISRLEQGNGKIGAVLQ